MWVGSLMLWALPGPLQTTPEPPLNLGMNLIYERCLDLACSVDLGLYELKNSTDWEA